jgi:CheY-like chemotaxis protein
MALNPLHRQVLLLVDEPPIRNLQTLVKKLEVENAADGSELVAKAMMNRKKFDAVILDLRCPNRRPGAEIHGIGNIQASRVGRTLAVTAEVNGPKTLDLVQRYLVNGLPGPLLWLVSHRYQSRPSWPHK